MMHVQRHLQNDQLGEVFKVFVLVARCVCILYGITIVTLGMFFLLLGGFDSGSWFKFVAGACALAVGLIPMTKAGRKSEGSGIIIVLALTGLGFQGLDVIHYYLFHSNPGNYYGWQIQLPVIAALAFMAVRGYTTLPESTETAG
ncbi:MAG: hypothetical protein EPN25_05060 [Nitrospirae bacterium]|nr:MAG: hypothetical protein EPN25_05060 [Nitrospirota bacterium]